MLMQLVAEQYFSFSQKYPLLLISLLPLSSSSILHLVYPSHLFPPLLHPPLPHILARNVILICRRCIQITKYPPDLIS